MATDLANLRNVDLPGKCILYLSVQQLISPIVNKVRNI